MLYLFQNLFFKYSATNSPDFSITANAKKAKGGNGHNKRLLRKPHCITHAATSLQAVCVVGRLVHGNGIGKWT